MTNSLCAVPLRLQWMMLQLQHYELEVRYIPSKDVPIPDALSHAQLPSTEDADDQMTTDIEVMVHTLTSSLPMISTRRAELQRATARN